MARLDTEYGAGIVQASHSALLELAVALGPYREALVLVGGWVPYLLLRRHGRPGTGFEHVGSIDIDLVVNPDRIGDREYSSLVELLHERAWKPSPQSRFSFRKGVPSPADGRTYDIQVDFLTPEPQDEGRKHRHRGIQPDFQARTMAGAPLVIAHNTPVDLSGALPSGARHAADLRMADVVGCVGTKGLILGGKRGRYKEKDAYDVWAVLEHYGEGPREVAAAVRPHLREPLLGEAILRMREWFSSETAPGPMAVADFFTAEEAEARKRRITRAFAVVATFLEALE